MATAAELKARYPEFTAVADVLVTAVLAEAGLSVDDTWRASDRSPAQLALAAHMLAIEGEPARSQGNLAMPGAGLPQKVKVGDTDITFTDISQARGQVNDLRRTPYGAAFVRWRARNFPSIRVV